jgi:hypothetical protein
MCYFTAVVTWVDTAETILYSDLLCARYSPLADTTSFVLSLDAVCLVLWLVLNWVELENL